MLMIIYLSTSLHSAIKINGSYVGQVLNEPISLPININDFIEIVPIGKNCLPFSFIFDDNFLSCPPEKIIITDLNGGYLLTYQNEIINTEEFKVISQKKFNDLVCTIFCDGNVKLSIETNCDFFAENIAFLVENADIDKLFINGKEFLVIILYYCKDKELLIFSYNGKIEKLLQKKIDKVDYNNTLITEENLLDLAKHNIRCEFIEQDGKFIENNRTVTCSENFNINNLSNKILPYAFLEEYLCGGNCHPYLCDNVKDNFEKLKEYLGEYIGIMPPPPFRDINEIGLIYKLSTQKYKVEYFAFEFENNKIYNIKKEP